MVDYYLYHELYDVTAHVVYVPHMKKQRHLWPLYKNYQKT